MSIHRVEGWILTLPRHGTWDTPPPTSIMGSEKCTVAKRGGMHPAGMLSYSFFVCSEIRLVNFSLAVNLSLLRIYCLSVYHKIHRINSIFRLFVPRSVVRILHMEIG